MDFDKFRIAMLNSLRIGPYDLPYKTNSPTAEWLIAGRGGPDNAYLTISDTSTPVELGTPAAPRDLAEQNTIVAVLAEEDLGTSKFLMLRHLPEGMSISGRFFPADGTANLSGTGGSFSLSAFGRHAHSRGTSGNHSILHDIPNPAPNSDGAINWHFSAEERPWIAAT
jgi:hypothetical protein